MADFTDDILLSAGANVNLTGEMFNEIFVSNGSTVSLLGSKSENINVSNGSQVFAYPLSNIVVSNGSQIDVVSHRPQSQFILSGNGVKRNAMNDYYMSVLRGAHNVKIDVSTPPGEPVLTSVNVAVESGTSVAQPIVTGTSFLVNPIGYGQSLLDITGGFDGVHAKLMVDVVDRYPDDPMVWNGSNSIVSGSPWIPDKGGISNNNDNNVAVSGYAKFVKGISVQNGSKVDVGYRENISVTAGSQISMTGLNPGKSDIRISTGTNIKLTPTVYLANEALAVSNGGFANLVSGNEVHVVHGTQVDMQGFGGIPTSSILVDNGNRVDTGRGYVIVRSKDERVACGSSVNVSGIMPGDILVTHHATANLFRGIQVEESDIIVENGSTVVLTGVAIGGTISDVSVPCEIFQASMNLGYQFVKGQITEIPEISLDSSIKLGVKLYSCDNTLLNVTTFTSAYMMFDDELQLPANIDPISNLIYVLATPSDLSTLTRNKVYDMRVHVVDVSGNPSIVLVQKLRFV